KIDTEVAVDWTSSPGVASIPVSVFYHQPVHDHVLRFCFAKHDATLIAAAKKLSAL
ncbi:MAG: methionine aminotransferase, partial [Flavobacteriales bacterium]